MSTLLALTFSAILWRHGSGRMAEIKTSLYFNPLKFFFLPAEKVMILMVFSLETSWAKLNFSS